MPDGILVVDKPVGFTSHDVVNIVRRAYGTKKVGHTGTLDPDATGALVLCLGEATKLVPYLTADDKIYDAAFVLGKRTTTLDASGEVLVTSTNTVSEIEIKAVLADFRGEIFQTPPMYSAIKIDGKKLYEYARAGKEVERKSRPVEIFQLELSTFCFPEGTLHVHCSSGTYIRSLIDDIGVKLGTFAYMKALRRIKIGRFTLDGAASVASLKRGECAPLLPLRSGVFHLPSLPLQHKDQMALLQGKKLYQVDAPGKLWRLEINGELRGIVERVFENGRSYVKLKRGIHANQEKSWKS